ncbi:MAG TPA: hypothetical protein VF077_12445 [Nitrospiraceae bacterium]
MTRWEKTLWCGMLDNLLGNGLWQLLGSGDWHHTVEIGFFQTVAAGTCWLAVKSELRENTR